MYVQIDTALRVRRRGERTGCPSSLYRRLRLLFFPHTIDSQGVTTVRVRVRLYVLFLRRKEGKESSVIITDTSSTATMSSSKS